MLTHERVEQAYIFVFLNALFAQINEHKDFSERSHQKLRLNIYHHISHMLHFIVFFHKERRAI